MEQLSFLIYDLFKEFEFDITYLNYQQNIILIKMNNMSRQDGEGCSSINFTFETY